MRLAALYVQLERPGDARKVLEATAARVPENEDIRAVFQKPP